MQRIATEGMQDTGTGPSGARTHLQDAKDAEAPLGAAAPVQPLLERVQQAFPRVQAPVRGGMDALAQLGVVVVALEGDPGVGVAVFLGLDFPVPQGVLVVHVAVEEAVPPRYEPPVPIVIKRGGCVRRREGRG